MEDEEALGSAETESESEAESRSSRLGLKLRGLREEASVWGFKTLSISVFILSSRGSSFSRRDLRVRGREGEGSTGNGRAIRREDGSAGRFLRAS